MESKEPVIGSTMPSYGDMSEDDKNKSGLNTLIKKYFAPGGLLIALLIRSATSGSTATASPIMPSGTNTSELNAGAILNMSMNIYSQRSLTTSPVSQPRTHARQSTLNSTGVE